MRSGNTGNTVEITDTNNIQQITNNINSLEYEEGDPSNNSSGWLYSIKWYNTDGKLIEQIVILDNKTIDYEDKFYKVSDGNIDIELLDDLLSTLKQLENQNFSIQGEIISYADDKTIVEFGKAFVNLFNGAVGEQEKVSFERYISNNNLLKFADKILELTQKQDLQGSNLVNYGLNNEFQQFELQHIEDNLCYLKLPFQFEGSGNTCKMLIISENKSLKLVDFYFGSKDGVDTLATGHPAEREINDPNLWENEEWVSGVFDKLKNFEEKLVTEENLEPTAYEVINNFDGVTMTIKEGTVSPTGLTVIFKNNSNAQCIYGEYFLLEKKINENWYQVPIAIDGNYGFNDIGYELTFGENEEWIVDWDWIYGSLDTGEYRIVKDILDFRNTGDYDEYYLVAEFTII
ncbi:immunoglobulin-like domain-containing protein [Tissierella sp. Yu-01]|uniref:immunoglobulin-like domain-containing protein n=1 Tax=Tissierella sp. Yu-01 TaxID=3035694 RepID=UPI00240D3063|nr:immunoglobulin-like domain-containing protein [Tissierella sp. Yu-01]WFA08772.1 hypothetical protein P3962_13755 [Tissierella sp. Yu-01]